MAAPAEYPDVIAVANLKGGVAKTTTAVFLSEAVARTGLTVGVLDTDPQASAAKWGARAAEQDTPLAAFVHQPFLDESVDRAIARVRAETGVDVVIVDTPPGAGDRDITLAAVKAARGCILPCRASVVEAREMGPTRQLAAAVGTPVIVLQVAVDMRMNDAKAFGEVLAGAGIESFRNRIPYNAKMMRAGGTRPDKLFGYLQVWGEIIGEDLEVI